MAINDTRDRILSQINLGQLIGETTTLRSQSGRLVGCCPFHEENSPSFYVFTDHYHCFGCGVHGDAISFIREKQGLGYIEALKFLGAKFSIDVSELQSPQARRQAQMFQRQNSIMESALGFYVGRLFSPEGERVRQYLVSRGISESLAQELNLGFAPMGVRLFQFLRDKGFNTSELEEASLIQVYEDSDSSSRPSKKVFDFFQDRVIIPVRQEQGKLIAFGGRALGDSKQKYKNSRYDKKMVLFGLNRARETIRKKQRTIIVEGYFDAIQLWNVGLTEAVACQGTALTRHHLALLKELGGIVYLLFDGDQAGINAALRAVELALEFPRLTFKACLLPKGQDPDSLAREQGATALEEVLAKGEDLLSFAIKLRLSAQSNSFSLPDLVRKELVPWISQIKDPLSQGFLLSELSQRSQIAVADLKNEMRSYRRLTNPSLQPFQQVAPSLRAAPKAEDPFQTKLSPLSKMHQDLLGLILFSKPAHFSSEIRQEMINFLRDEAPLESAWGFLFKEIFDLVELGNCPGDLLDSKNLALSAMAFHEVRVVLQQMLLRRKAYETDQVQPRFRILQAYHRQTIIRASILKLKDELSQKNPQTDRDGFLMVMRQLSDLSTKLKNLI